MKATLLCLLALTAVAAVSSSASFEKVNLGASFLSREVRRTLRGRQEECGGFCLVHFDDPEDCGLGYVLDKCDADQTSLGESDDGCECCIPNDELEEDPEEDDVLDVYFEDDDEE